MPVDMVQEKLDTTCHLISPDRLGYAKIYMDQISGRQPAMELYLAASLDDVAAKLEAVAYDRSAMADILRKQNESYGASRQTLDNIERLKDPRAVCLFAGQQAGLFGGPLLSLVKALAVAKSARLYEERLGRPVIPIFWIAGDDHDFEEANHTWVLTRQGEPCKNSYQTAPELPVPTSEIKLSDADELARVKKQLRDCLGETDFTPGLFENLDRAYSTQQTMVTAFARFMTGLTSDFGLAFFSPGDPVAKRIVAPFFRRVLDLQDEIHSRLTDANRRIEEAGYHIQVEKKDEAAHLFYNLDGRTPVLRDGDRFTVGEESFSREDLLARIEEHPERFSPDVMLRPVLQSFLFPVVSQKGGPAEIAYLAQLNPLFGLFDLPAPVHKARPTMTLVEARTAQHMNDLRISFEDLLGDIEQTINRVLARTFPDYLEEDFNALRESLERQFRKFRDEALDFEPGLKKFAEQIKGKIDYTLKNFESKVFAAHKKKMQQTRDRIYRIHNALYTEHGLQERTLDITYFLARYGGGVVRYMYDRLEPEIHEHQLICLSEYQT